jgi:hypothetical protein
MLIRTEADRGTFDLDHDAAGTTGTGGHHANVGGQFPVDFVDYEVIFNTDVTGNTFDPKGMNVDDAKFLCETAGKSVEVVAALTPRER